MYQVHVGCRLLELRYEECMDGHTDASYGDPGAQSLSDPGKLPESAQWPRLVPGKQNINAINKFIFFKSIIEMHY